MVHSLRESTGCGEGGDGAGCARASESSPVLRQLGILFRYASGVDVQTALLAWPSPRIAFFAGEGSIAWAEMKHAAGTLDDSLRVGLLQRSPGT